MKTSTTKSPKLLSSQETLLPAMKLRDKYCRLVLGELNPTGRCPTSEVIVREAGYYALRTEGERKKQFEQILRLASRKELSEDDRRERLKCKVPIKCPICLVNKKLVQTFKTNCGHYFCKPCFRRCLETKLSCQLCTQMIKTVTGDRVYAIARQAGRLVIRGLMRPRSVLADCERED